MKLIRKNAALKNMKYPVKHDINLAQKVKRDLNLKAVIPTAIVLAIGIATFTKFGVIDQLNAFNTAETEAVKAEMMLSDIQTKTQDFDAVQTEYSDYTVTKNLTAGPAPMDCINLLETRLLQSAKVRSFQMTDNIISVELSGVTLNQISGIYANLLSSDLVRNVQVFTASTTHQRNAKVSATMTILLNDNNDGLAGELPPDGGIAK